jgi:hypothetical protein
VKKELLEIYRLLEPAAVEQPASGPDIRTPDAPGSSSASPPK